jgi:hypothetical protein
MLDIKSSLDVIKELKVAQEICNLDKVTTL